MKLVPVIGLEIHIQLKTKSKMFCPCPNKDEGKPNSFICPICTGQPGVLPAPNKEAVKMALKAAIALNCKIREVSYFARKNYFYPDLPKGYQITQYDAPLAEAGYLEIDTSSKKTKQIGIKRLHLEEDTAKLIHTGEETLIDFNRAGTPLIEIVTLPQISSPEEAKNFLKELRLIMRYLKISDADMEKGHLRCDANISLRPEGEERLYSKTEIKNLNSFKAVERALSYEIKRQTKLWEEKKIPTAQSTRSWNEKLGKTEELRGKEEEADYRYFPEPDIPPLVFSTQDLAQIDKQIPELPRAKRIRFTTQYALNISQASTLIQNKFLADYFEEIVSELKAWLETLHIKDHRLIWAQKKDKLLKLTCDWLLNRFLGYLNEENIPLEENRVTAENFAEFISLLFEEKISSSQGQEILKEMVKKGGDPSQIMEEKGLGIISDQKFLEEVINKVLEKHKKAVEEYKKGKKNAAQFLIGQVMRETKGKANPKLVSDLIFHKLK